MFGESDSDELRERQNRVIARQARNMPRNVLEVRSSPVVLDDVKFAKGYGQIEGRFWLNGASGARIRKSYEAVNKEDWRRERYLNAFHRTRSKGVSGLPTYDGKRASKMEIAIELKNGFNYYHFSTETLGSLAHFIDDDSMKPINIHLPKGDIKGFVKNFIDAVYPSLSERINFVSKPTRYKQVRSVYSHRHYLYCVNDENVRAVLESPDMDPKWRGIALDPKRIGIAGIQSYDESLAMLRREALSQAVGTATLSTPRFIWMGRDETGQNARVRGITGHQPLLEELMGRGFEVVAFEHLSPLEQIATMNGADILIAPHGAGLANMTYAKPGATVIEIGTRQTQMHRWGDFAKCAHVSRCRYDTVFADITGLNDIAQIPPVSKGLLGVHVGKRATDRIISIVDEAMQAA